MEHFMNGGGFNLISLFQVLLEFSCQGEGASLSCFFTFQPQTTHELPIFTQ